MVKRQTNWQLNSIPTDIQFLIFNFQVYLPWLLKPKMLIVHVQCLLRVDGSIMAGVLTLCCNCLNLHIPLTQQVAAYW